MKLICLNIEGGKHFEPLLEFLKNQSADTDVFCLQEVFDTLISPPPTMGMDYHADIYKQVVHALPEFEGHFGVAVENFDFKGRTTFPLRNGMAIFVRKAVQITESGNSFLSGLEYVALEGHVSIPRNLQHVTLKVGNGLLTVANFHGLLDDGHKYDTAARIAQFEQIVEFLRNVKHSKIFCGDLNVRQNTQSIHMFEEAGMRDLIKGFGVTLTRNENYAGWKQYNDPISDYMFVSPDIKVKKFEVLPDIVSDHQALELEFEV